MTTFFYFIPTMLKLMRNETLQSLLLSEVFARGEEPKVAREWAGFSTEIR